ncbi:MAG: hypothetical protein U0T74_07975 [Chitinophagales bacterium]
MPCNNFKKTNYEKRNNPNACSWRILRPHYYELLGEKFTPLTQEQISNSGGSLVNAQSEAKLAELRAACESGLEAQVNAKVEALKTAETAEAAQ